MSYLDALFTLNGKVALVTGSNRGIGFCLARGLARAGATVVLNGRDRERTEAAARDLKDEGLAASTSIADVTDREAVIREVKRIEEQFGALDVVVNNAGIQYRAPFVEFPAEKFDAIMRSNVYGPFFVAQAAAKGMIARGARFDHQHLLGAERAWASVHRALHDFQGRDEDDDKGYGGGARSLGREGQRARARLLSAQTSTKR